VSLGGSRGGWKGPTSNESRSLLVLPSAPSPRAVGTSRPDDNVARNANALITLDPRINRRGVLIARGLSRVAALPSARPLGMERGLSPSPPPPSPRPSCGADSTLADSGKLPVVRARRARYMDGSAARGSRFSRLGNFCGRGRPYLRSLFAPPSLAVQFLRKIYAISGSGGAHFSGSRDRGYQFPNGRLR